MKRKQTKPARTPRATTGDTMASLRADIAATRRVLAFAKRASRALRALGAIK